MYKALRAGYLFQGKYFSPDMGTPQGSIVSPILCNILMNKFDSFMSELTLGFEKGKRHRINPEWRRLSRTGLLKVVHSRDISSRMHIDPNYKRLKYVRYADDFLVGVIGSRQDCLLLIDKINTFLTSELLLNLNLDKTKVTHARADMAHFLGTNIRITPLDKRPFRTVHRGDQTYLLKSATRPQLLAPIGKIVDRLTAKGIARHGGNPTR